MTNNYIKVTTRTTRPFAECEHLAPEARARSYSNKHTNNEQEYNNLTWFLPTNDRDPVQFDAAIARAHDIAEQCREAFGVKHRGCFVSVYRDFPGNTLPVIGCVE